MLDKQARQASLSAAPSAAPAPGSDQRTLLSLEVCRGRTQFPVRPIASDRFLIGSGKRCDLRLGGSVPPLHCIIYRDGGDVWLDAIAAQPAIKVNGRVAQCVRLHDGDLIEIASFHFRLRCALPTASSAIASKAEHVEPASLSAEPADVESMSAAELVERLAAELEDVEEFEDRRLTGAEALLAAAEQLAVEQAEAAPEIHPAAIPITERLPAASSDEALLLIELEDLLGRVTALAEFLDERPVIIGAHPAIVDMIADSHRRLNAELENVLQQLAAKSQFKGPTRASA